MRYDTVLFDMDGTLLNTLDDLHTSVNELLAREGFSPRTKDEIRLALGNGAKRLLQASLPEGVDDAELERYLRLYKPIYEKNMSKNTRPYDGILDMLRALKQSGIKTGVITNKPDYACAALCDSMFEGLIGEAVGDRPDLVRKPAPDSVFIILERLGSRAENTLYVGDSDVDILTAKNAGLTSVGVSWGYRDEQLLKDTGADYIIYRPAELLKIIGS